MEKKIIINGHGTIGTDGKYIISPLDRGESKTIIGKFYKAVAKIIADKFGSVSTYEEPNYNKMLEQAGAILLTPTITIQSPNFCTNKNVLVFVKTGINRNGYGENTVKRHFTISFDVDGIVRYKFQKKWEQGTIINKYTLADNMQDCLDEFKSWLNNEYSNFIKNRVPKNLR